MSPVCGFIRKVSKLTRFEDTFAGMILEEGWLGNLDSNQD
ncbi:hypothetical protein SIAM614_14008 [Stappia aggregata IAM 12614]|uniref:Uncharacterized protein n=1 Tax=Roseibium aggregatum (strain ATCC 25650 / DSM 13394 / JCM 20685 / NBRC 16684 / NCIMB 2208 / IAM 12614 / B1) TaxID=384765 RepID=A0NQS7_ROSAI|nr:hypothetical protein SIAM614_14008 [Stappia aggregata IAM 12614] [Roseibium aggregatum IAM 12614]